MKKLIVALVVLGLIWISGVMGVNGVKGEEYLYRRSALSFIKSQEYVIPQLKGVDVISPLVYKDKHGIERVIVYGVEKENRIIGRIVINYDKDNPVFLEFAETPPPHLVNVKDEVIRKISLKGNQTLENEDFSYVFPLLFFIHFDIMEDNKKVDDLYFFFNEKRVVKVDEIPEFLKFKLPKESVLEKSYNILLDIADYNTADTNYLCNNCGPVSGAIILNYWDKNGYDDLQFNFDRENGVYLTTCLWNDMKTSCIWGTPPGNYANGICNHANIIHNGYNCNYRFNYNINWDPKYGDVCNEINNSRPLGILVKYISGPFHWITCYGYYFGYGGYYIYVRDGYGDGNVVVNWDAPELPDGSISFWTLVYIYPSY